MGRHKKEEIKEEVSNILYLEAKRQNMRDSCRLYRSQPIQEMTDQEAKSFSIRQAIAAAETLKMNEQEVLQYGNSILSSILYFNHRDEKHQQHILYMRECQRAERYSEKLKDEEKKRQKAMRIFIN